MAERDPAALDSVLEQACQCLGQLHELLKDEVERLGQRQVEGLDELLKAKVDALQGLEAAERERQSIVTAAGFEPTPQGMRAFLEASDEPALNELWDRFAGMLQELKMLNDANGRLIGRSLEQVQFELDLITGIASEPSDTTYDPKGRQGGARSRKIDSA